MKHAFVDATLVYGAHAAEGGADPFALAAGDDAPLPRPTRAGLAWEGRAWVEIDPATGRVLAIGEETAP